MYNDELGLNWETGRSRLDNVHYMIAKTKESLASNGFRVDDTKIIKRIPEREYYGPLIDDYEYADIDYDVEYTVRMYQSMAEDVLDLATHLERSERERNEIKRQLANLKEQHLEMKMKTTSLRTVLEKNPAIKEQWDEIMTMLKLAGFDDDLTKD